MQFEFNEEYHAGDLVVYIPTDQDGNVYKAEIGVVKRYNNTKDGVFVYYSGGDTAACTKLRDLRKLDNAYAIEDLLRRVKEIKDENV